MAVEFSRVLPRVAVGSTADKGQAVIHGPAPGVQDRTVDQLPVRRIGQGRFSSGAEDLSRSLCGSLARQAQDPHPAPAGRRSDGSDEIGHGASLLPDLLRNFGESTGSLLLTAIFDKRFCIDL